MYARFWGLTRGLVALESWLFMLLLVLLMMLGYLGPGSVHYPPVVAPASVRACCTQCWTGSTAGIRTATVSHFLYGVGCLWAPIALTTAEG